MFIIYCQKNNSTYTLFFDSFRNSKIIRFHVGNWDEKQTVKLKMEGLTLDVQQENPASYSGLRAIETAINFKMSR